MLSSKTRAARLTLCVSAVYERSRNGETMLSDQEVNYADSPRPRLALALSGGAARGFAHVGVLRSLERHKISVDMIAGTSAGALVGGAYAAGLSVAEIIALGRDLSWRNIGRMTLSRSGLQSNRLLETIVQEKFPVTRFEQMRIPFAAVATDLHTGAPVVMSGRGDVAFAIRASCAVPGLYIPVVDEHGRQLVDGGLAAIVPATAARDLGADVVVAVDVNFEGAKFLGPPQSFIGVLIQSFMIVQRTVTAAQVASADVAIRPRVGHIRWDEMKRGEELIRLGEEAADEAAEHIKNALTITPAHMI